MQRQSRAGSSALVSCYRTMSVLIASASDSIRHLSSPTHTKADGPAMSQSCACSHCSPAPLSDSRTRGEGAGKEKECRRGAEATSEPTAVEVAAGAGMGGASDDMACDEIVRSCCDANE